MAALNDMDGVRINLPEGAFYVFPNISAFYGKSDGETKIENSDDLAMYILMKAKVATVTGRAFGAPECIRISYAASEEELKEAMSRIKSALADLK